MTYFKARLLKYGKLNKEQIKLSQSPSVLVHITKLPRDLRQMRKVGRCLSVEAGDHSS